MRHKVSAGLPVIVLAAAVCFAAGCSRKDPAPDPQSGQMSTEMQENVTEEETEEMIDYRPIREVLSPEIVEWADQFDEEKVKLFTYTSIGETKYTYELDDPHTIRKFFDALMELTAAGKSDAYGSEPGDTFVFEMKDGSTVEFSFIMTCIILDQQPYETDNGDALWELTGALLAQDLL